MLMSQTNLFGPRSWVSQSPRYKNELTPARCGKQCSNPIDANEQTTFGSRSWFTLTAPCKHSPLDLHVSSFVMAIAWGTAAPRILSLSLSLSLSLASEHAIQSSAIVTRRQPQVANRMRSSCVVSSGISQLISCGTTRGAVSRC